MSVPERKVHKITVNSPQTITVPRQSAFALRKSRLVRRRFRQVFYTIGFTLSLVAIAHASYGFIMDTPYLRIKETRIEGVNGNLAAELKGLVTTLTRGQRNILDIDAAELSKEIARHPRIRDLKVEKIYPDQLVVHAVERQEVAVLATPSGFYLVDSESHAMEKLDTQRLAEAKLPYISGLKDDMVHEGEPVKSESLRKAISLLGVLKERNPELYARVSEIQIQSDGVSSIESLTAHMKGGLDVRFGDSNPIKKLAGYETLVTMLKKQGVDPYKDLVYIDLRFGDMAFYMDLETAMDVDRETYDVVQAKMEEASESYEKAHPLKSGAGAAEDDEEEAPASRKAESPKKAAPKVATRQRTAPAQGRGQQIPANYRQIPQQNFPQQYYQQRPQQPAGQSFPMYNLPANQSR